MKRLKDIRLMIEIAQQGWREIECEMVRLHSFDSGSLCMKKEGLKNLLEEIRKNLEAWLLKWDNTILKKICINFLEKIMVISENLRKSYMFPGYTESYYIADTIAMAKH
jgi:hypothetical protein